MILHWLTSTVTILITAYILPNVEMTLGGAFIFALVLGILNLFLKPILHIFAFPITIITLGLFSFVINALIILLADALVPSVTIGGFVSAFLFAIILSLVHIVFNRIVPTT